jgi:acyl-coenzyme A thioesterase PaaI-like protein
MDAESTRAIRARLAAALRALVSDVIDHDLSDEAAVDLIADVEDLQARATGPRRPRYYETARVGSPSASFVDYSPVSGRAHPWAIPMSIERAAGPDGDPGVRARLRIGADHEGPPHGVHGGVVADIFDELFGHAQAAHDMQALTAKLTIRYKAVTPIHQDLVFFAQVVHASGRRWNGQAWCRAGEAVTAAAEAVFIGVDLGAMVRPSQLDGEDAGIEVPGVAGDEEPV